MEFEGYRSFVFNYRSIQGFIVLSLFSFVNINQSLFVKKIVYY